MYLSAISMNPNSCDDHRTNSSDMEDRWIDVNDAQNANSVTKSLSLTESIELNVGPLNPSDLAVISLSMGYVVPARAAEPRGQRLSLSKASRKRCASRESLNA